MPNLNVVFLIGNATRDPELRFTPKGTAVADIGMAVNRFFTNERGEKMEETTFVDITLWGRTAEIAGEYLTKGRPFMIEGRLKLDTWDDKESGQKRSKLKVIAENLQLLGSRDDSDRTERTDQGRAPGRGYQSSRPAAPPPRKPRDPDLDVSDDDIPF